MIPALAIGSALDFMRGKWWMVLVAGLLVWVVIEKGNARHWEKRALNCEQRIEIAKREAAEQAAANSKRLADATADYAARESSRQPIILTSKETVREYAQTPAGASQCLDAGRVSGIDDLDARIAASAPSGGPGAVPANPGPSPD